MIKNLPAIDEELIVKLRKANENRGLWYYYLLKTAKDKGFDMEKLARKGVRKVGQSRKPDYPDTTDLKTFVKAFMGDIDKKLFEMELISMDDKEARIEFHYCPMTGIWTKLTEDQEFIEQICDIAMDTDRGLFDKYDCFEFSLGRTICGGHDTCEIFIKKVK